MKKRGGAPGASPDMGIAGFGGGGGSGPSTIRARRERGNERDRDRETRLAGTPRP